MSHLQQIIAGHLNQRGYDAESIPNSNTIIVQQPNCDIFVQSEVLMYYYGLYTSHHPIRTSFNLSDPELLTKLVHALECCTKS